MIYHQPYTVKKVLHKERYLGYIPLYRKDYRYFICYEDTELFWMGSSDLAKFVTMKMNIAHKVGISDSHRYHV